MKDLGFLETENFCITTENNSMSEEEIFFALMQYKKEVEE